MEYILGPKPDSCVFCLPEDRSGDRDRLVLYRGRKVFVILNRYPFAAGHLMVVPFVHVPSVIDLDAETSFELMELVKASVSVLNERSRPNGVNIGFNIGEAAGAGIKEHLHCHVVPRWNGDSNFMTAIGEVRAIPEHLKATYDALEPLFSRIGQA